MLKIVTHCLTKQASKDPRSKDRNLTCNITFLSLSLRELKTPVFEF